MNKTREVKKYRIEKIERLLSDIANAHSEDDPMPKVLEILQVMLDDMKDTSTHSRL